MTTITKREMLLGGPGLCGYAYKAAVYCDDCGRDIIEGGPDELPQFDACDSEITPMPIFFGESECAQYCDNCGEYCYGGDLDELRSNGPRSK